MKHACHCAHKLIRKPPLLVDSTGVELDADVCAAEELDDVAVDKCLAIDVGGLRFSDKHAEVVRSRLVSVEHCVVLPLSGLKGKRGCAVHGWIDKDQVDKFFVAADLGRRERVRRARRFRGCVCTIGLIKAARARLRPRDASGTRHRPAKPHRAVPSLPWSV